MKNIENDIVEIEEFLQNVSFTSLILSSEDTLARFKSAYKPFKSLLIWGLVFEQSNSVDVDQRTYFRETLADLSHSFVLTLMNFYKPARLSLRGSIENYLRFLILRTGGSISQVKTVYQLFDTTKSIFQPVSHILQDINRIEQVYAELCKTVHSQKSDYMSLTIPFNRLCSPLKKEFSHNVTLLKQTSAPINRIIFSICHQQLKIVGHKNEDIVRDSISKTIKKIVHSL